MFFYSFLCCVGDNFSIFECHINPFDWGSDDASKVDSPLDVTAEDNKEAFFVFFISHLFELTLNQVFST
jgi:hypothetical protein